MPRSADARKTRPNIETFRTSDEEHKNLRRAAKKLKKPRTVLVREAVLEKVAALLAAA